MLGSSTEGLGEEIRAFVAALKKRSDIRVLVADVRKPAKAAEIAQTHLPADLSAFYAVADGLEIDWEFVEGEGGGRICLAGLRQTSFEGDDETHMGFGRGVEAYLLDEQTPEAGTWLVRKKDAAARLVYAAAGEGNEGFVPASSVAEYVRKALHYGLVTHWPELDRPGELGPPAEAAHALERFRGPVQKKSAVEPGARASFQANDQRGRAEVLALRERGPLVRIRTDDGREGWLDRKDVMAFEGADTYEALRRDGIRGRHDVVALGEEIVRAVGTGVVSVCGLGTLPTTGYRAAGLFGDRPFADALEDVLVFWEGIRGVPAAKDDDALPAIGAPATRALAAAGYVRLSQLSRATLPPLGKLHGVGPKAIRILEDALPPAFDPQEDRPFSSKGAPFPIEARGVRTFRLGFALAALLAGLCVVAYRESSARKKAGSTLASPSTITRLEQLASLSVGPYASERKPADALLVALRWPKPLPSPYGKLDSLTLGWHGLPATEGVGLPRWIGKSPLFPGFGG